MGWTLGGPINRAFVTTPVMLDGSLQEKILWAQESDEGQEGFVVLAEVHWSSNEPLPDTDSPHGWKTLRLVGNVQFPGLDRSAPPEAPSEEGLRYTFNVSPSGKGYTLIGNTGGMGNLWMPNPKKGRMVPHVPPNQQNTGTLPAGPAGQATGSSASPVSAPLAAPTHPLQWNELATEDVIAEVQDYFERHLAGENSWSTRKPLVLQKPGPLTGLHEDDHTQYFYGMEGFEHALKPPFGYNDDAAMVGKTEPPDLYEAEEKPLIYREFNPRIDSQVFGTRTMDAHLQITLSQEFLATLEEEKIKEHLARAAEAMARALREM